MPVGNVTYHHRRKYSPQVPSDYQSRIFFGDYVRENRSRVGGNGPAGAIGGSAVVNEKSGSLSSQVTGGSGTDTEELYSLSTGGVASVLGQDICTTHNNNNNNNNGSNNPPSASQCSTPIGSDVNTFGSTASHNGNGPISPVSPQRPQRQQISSGQSGQQSSAQNYLSSALYSVQRTDLVGPGGCESGVGAVSVSCNSNSNNNNNSINNNGINNNNTGEPVVNGALAVGGGGADSSLSGVPVTASRVSSCISGNSHSNDCEHQSSPGPGSSTDSYLVSGSNIDTLQQQQQQLLLQQQQQQQQQTLYRQYPGQAQHQPQQQQQSSSLSSSASLITNNNQIRDRDSTNYVSALTLGTPVNASSSGGAGIGSSGQNSGSINSHTHVNLVGASTVPSTMTTSTAISPPRPMQKVIPTVVYLMSRIAVHMEIEGTAQCPAQVMLAAALGCEELGITNKLLAQSVFGLWMTSPLLEVQLKPHHRPYAVRVAWSKLLEKHSHGNELEKLSDEPMTMLRRNVFFSRKDEEKIKDPRILELLYEEARHNVLLGRYVMESSHSIMLGGIQARIELGPYNSHTHTTSYFRENQFRFLPAHVAKSSSWSWLPISRRTSAEVRLLEQFKRVPTTATTKKLMRKYLEFCWGLPLYGAAYFHGQVEQPVRGLMGLVQQKDLPVLIAVNERGIFVIDQIECTLLLGLKYEEVSWDFAKPSNMNDSDCLSCIFLQFGAVENGIAVTKLMQIFTRQAAMIDALITHFIEQAKRRKESGEPEVPAGENQYEAEPNPIQNSGMGVLSNKLSRLTLATFDDEGRCIGQTGSLSISY